MEQSYLAGNLTEYSAPMLCIYQLKMSFRVIHNLLCCFKKTIWILKLPKTHL